MTSTSTPAPAHAAILCWLRIDAAGVGYMAQLCSRAASESRDGAPPKAAAHHGDAVGTGAADDGGLESSYGGGSGGGQGRSGSGDADGPDGARCCHRGKLLRLLKSSHLPIPCCARVMQAARPSSSPPKAPACFLSRALSLAVCARVCCRESKRENAG